MKTATFETNINCSSCKAAVTPYLARVKGIESWEVDTTKKEKPLEVKGDFDEEEVVKAVQEAGYKIERHKESFFKKLFS